MSYVSRRPNDVEAVAIDVEQNRTQATTWTSAVAFLREYAQALRVAHPSPERVALDRIIVSGDHTPQWHEFVSQVLRDAGVVKPPYSGWVVTLAIEHYRFASATGDTAGVEPYVFGSEQAATTVARMLQHLGARAVPWPEST